MKLFYYAETDSLYLELSRRRSSDSLEAVPGIVLDIDRKGLLVGIDIDHASKVVDLKRVEAIGLPVKHSLRNVSPLPRRTWKTGEKK